VKIFGNAANIAPKMPTVYRNWARMEIEAGFYARAKECISKAVDLAPGDTRMWREWGSIEMKAQHYDEAAARVEHALQIEPDDAQLLNLLGEIEKRRGSHARADALFRRALNKFQSSNEMTHVLITKTAMADNLRRWAELLMGSDSETATSYLNQGYRIMAEAASTDSSPRSQATLREIAFALGRLCERLGQVGDAIRHYDTSISWNPIRRIDKLKAAEAARYIADHLLRAERREESRKYLDLARAYSREPETLKQLDGMEMDYNTGRRRGVLRVIPGKGYGFLARDTGSAVFLHHSNVIPPVSIPQFDKLEGQEFGFVVVERQGKPAAIRACTRVPMARTGAMAE